MSEPDVEGVVENACRRISAKLPSLLQTISRDDQLFLDNSPAAGADGIILDRQILLEVERAFDDIGHNRVAALLYSMAHRGAPAEDSFGAAAPKDDLPEPLPSYDPASRPSYGDDPEPHTLRGGSDLLHWIDARYPQLKALKDLEDPQADRGPRPWQDWLVMPEDFWPDRRLSYPKEVLKSNRTRVPFRMRNLRHSLERAVVTNPDLQGKVPELAEWVVSHVQGQAVVKSSQLATFAMDVLRKTDDLSYLRFAFIQKNYTHISECGPEIVGLIRYPSRRLRFIPQEPSALHPGNVQMVEQAAKQLSQWLGGYRAITSGQP
ncbi:MAG: hypothetical protein LBS27_02630 [Bifidobacteriaceae bacterium]|nr:hypothetical protein [Bifidobacteriaceae bacterium]